MASILAEIRAPEGSSKSRRRRGRGLGSGLGKTGGKGQKGQKARHPGNFSKTAFQGGQTPLQRRLPKRGFNVPFPAEIAIVNVGALSKRFDKGATVDLEALKNSGLVARSAKTVKILGEGEVDRALTLKVDAISAGARGKVEKAGGSVTVPSSEGAA